MFGNANLWIALISLAKEMFAYYRADKKCPKQSKANVESIKKAFKTKNRDEIKKAVGNNV